MELLEERNLKELKKTFKGVEYCKNIERNNFFDMQEGLTVQ